MNGTENPKTTAQQPEEISVSDLVKKGLGAIKGLFAQWKLLLLLAVLGAALGVVYSLISKPKYTAVCTFVLDENDKSGVLGQYAGLAAMAGIDVNGGGDIFKGDNILELYRSRLMIKKTLLTNVTIDNKTQKLIDRYAIKTDLREKWKKDDEIGDISFAGDPDKFNRKQDSLITDIAEMFNMKYLDVSKPDKKLSVIRVAFTAKDELFAKLFTDHLVENVNDFYVQTKTKKTTQNIQILKYQSDSVRSELNSALTGVASAIDAAPNANPARISLRVPSQKRQVDVQAGNIIYGEMIKNLELSKLTLRQQTPLIQFIDQPVLPLEKSQVGKVKGAVIGAFLMIFLSSFWLLTKRLLQKIG